MKNFFAYINPFRKPSANELIKDSLAEYARQLVEQEAAAAYHRKMAEFYKEGMARLTTQAILLS